MTEPDDDFLFAELLSSEPSDSTWHDLVTTALGSAPEEADPSLIPEEEFEDESEIEPFEGDDPDELDDPDDSRIGLGDRDGEDDHPEDDHPEVDRDDWPDEHPAEWTAHDTAHGHASEPGADWPGGEDAGLDDHGSTW